MKNLTRTVVGLSLSLTILAAASARAAEPAPATPPAAAKSGAKEVTLKGTLGCGKCSFNEAKACENVLKVPAEGSTGKVETYLLADNEVSRANHEKVCGPASPATVTGTVSAGKGKHARKVLTASAITFE